MATAAQWQRVAHPRRLVESGLRAKDRIQRADREVAGPSSRSSTARSNQRTGFRPSFHIHTHRPPARRQRVFLQLSEPPASPLSLALAMTEKHEKAERAEIMRERGCTELEAVHVVAERIATERGGRQLSIETQTIE